MEAQAVPSGQAGFRERTGAMTRDEILSSLRERILAFAASRVTREAAEDLTQDVLMLLHEKYPQVTVLTELLPLSFKILRFKLLEAHRKALRRGEYNQVPVEALPLEAPGGNPGWEVEQKQVVERLIEAMTQLGVRCRELFRLKLEGRTFPEIQRIMQQRSINTIYTWDRRCRQQLLDRIGGSWESLHDDRSTPGASSRARG